MSTRKYEDLIKQKRANLESIRQERKQLQIDKSARDAEQAREKIQEKLTTIDDINEVCAEFNITSTKNISPPTVESKSEPEECIKTTCVDTTTITKGDVFQKLSKLSVSNTKITDIQPKKIFTSTKSTQTSGSRIHPQPFVLQKFDDNDDEYSSNGGFDSKLPPGCMSPGLPKLQFVMPAVTPLEHIPECTEVKELSEEDKQAILSNKDFQNAIQRIGRVMENVVSKNIDVTRDYVRAMGNEDDINEKSRGRVSLNRIFYDNQWSKNRCVTDVDWSVHFPEWMVASYHSNEDEPLEPEGIVMIWNTLFQKPTPDHIFHSSSAVMSVCCATFNPHLILGGTYSGQIVIWDSRSPKPIPVQSTTLNCGAHVQPVHSLRVIGTESSHNIVSISSDGRLCSWNLEMLSNPVDILTLEKEPKKPIAVTCMAFAGNNCNDLMVGCEDGCVYSAHRSGINTAGGISGKFEQHDGPITSVSTHYDQSSPECSHVFLTSSLDSTIKLWSLRDTEPLHTFKNNCDYVMDVSWSPINPAMFAAIDGSGRLDLWNLNIDTEDPTVSVVLEGQPALNRLSWMANGQHIIVGDIDGKVYLYDIDDHLAQPLPDEHSAFADTSKMLKQKILYS